MVIEDEGTLSANGLSKEVGSRFDNNIVGVDILDDSTITTSVVTIERSLDNGVNWKLLFTATGADTKNVTGGSNMLVRIQVASYAAGDSIHYSMSSK